MRLTQFLSDQQVAFEEMVHPPAFTSQKLAKFLHVSGKLQCAFSPIPSTWLFDEALSGLRLR